MDFDVFFVVFIVMFVLAFHIMKGRKLRQRHGKF